MKRNILLSAIVVLSLPKCAVADEGSNLRAYADYFVNEPENPRFDTQEQEAALGPVSADVADSMTKAKAASSADYGFLGAAAEIDPDIGDDSILMAYSIASFYDFLTITGDNVGASATATFRMRVVGEVRQPFVVTEAVGYASAIAELGASSETAVGVYTAMGLGSPVVNSFDDMLEVNVPFTVGGTIPLYAFLEATAEAYDLNIDPSAIGFSALFGNTAELMPIHLQGAANPHVVAESGATYAFVVPEPGCAILILLGSVMAVVARVNY